MDKSSVNWLTECIQEWKKANSDKGNTVQFVGSFVIVGLDNFEVKESGLFAFGLKKLLLKGLEKIECEINDSEDPFINW